jgi:hypothetical protein
LHDDLVILQQPHGRAGNAVHAVAGLGRAGAADEAFRAAPQIVVQACCSAATA